MGGGGRDMFLRKGASCVPLGRRANGDKVYERRHVSEDACVRLCCFECGGGGRGWKGVEGGSSTFADKQYVTGEVGAADLCGAGGGGGGGTETVCMKISI